MNRLNLSLLLVLSSVLSFITLADESFVNEYFVAEVLSSDTVYEPAARYIYTVRPLGNLSQLTDEPLPTTFSTDVVLKKETVGEGYWMLARVNRTTGQVYTLDVTKPEVGFSGSTYFKRIFLDRLEDLLLPAQPNITREYGKANVKVNLGVSDDFSIQSRYNKAKNNLALVVTDYYIDQIITDFSPFFARYDEFNFEVTFAKGIVIAKSLNYRRANYFLYQSIDEEEPLPPFLTKQSNANSVGN